MAEQSLELLPDSRLRSPKNVREHRGMMWQPLFCASCSTDKGGGWVPEPPENCTFAFYLCDPCYEKYGQVAGTMVEPDVAFWERVKQAQVEEFGRVLTPQETAEALKDENHILAKLAKDRP